MPRVRARSFRHFRWATRFGSHKHRATRYWTVWMGYQAMQTKSNIQGIFGVKTGSFQETRYAKRQ